MEHPQTSHSKEATDLFRKDHGEAPSQRLQIKQRGRSGGGHRTLRLMGGLLESLTRSMSPKSLLPASGRTVGIQACGPIPLSKPHPVTEILGEKERFSEEIDQTV